MINYKKKTETTENFEVYFEVLKNSVVKDKHKNYPERSPPPH